MHIADISIIVIICFVSSYSTESTTDKRPTPAKKEDARRVRLPPCQLCNTFIESFKSEYKRTERGKFEGGDTAWEEKNLKTYDTSEIRLVEIEEGLCENLDRAQDHCHEFVQEHEHHIEDWWKHHQKHTDLRQWMCVEQLHVCCPDQHYGINCTACVGYPDNVCTNNGRCKGAGTRKGNGQCVCNVGYTSATCNECDRGYFAAYKDTKKVICDKCHVACLDTCAGAGAQACNACADGWTQSDKGCVDVNECLTKKNPCKPNEFCVNKEGAYACIGCDRSCFGCTGDGPDMCTTCADGFVLKDNLCVDASEQRSQWYVQASRYGVYIGLCVCACIIFQKNMVIAGVIGVAIAAYITVSEYVVKNDNHGKPIISEELSKLLSDFRNM